MALVMAFGLVGCASNSEKSSSDTSQNSDVSKMTFDELKEAASGQTVTFYGWGGDDDLNKWLDDVFAPRMKEKYNITMERVPMDIDQVLAQLNGEVSAGDNKGAIDMIWINGENFKSAKENNLLYGPFVNLLPNYKSYVDENDEDNTLDFGFPIEGYECPYGKAQMVMVTDSTITTNPPKSADELLEFAKEHPGKVTYPALPDFTGSVFVRNLIYEKCGGYEQFMNMSADKATVKAAIEPALEYLRELNPYLWNQGKTFPESSTTTTKMFGDGELVMNMTYDALGTSINIEKGTYKDTAYSFQFDKGTIGNTNFMAISKSSQHKAGALVAINEMISPEVQADRFKTMNVLPVLDNSKLTDQDKEYFTSIETKKGDISQEELLSKRLPEMPAALVPIIEEIWNEEVVGK